MPKRPKLGCPPKPVLRPRASKAIREDIEAALGAKPVDVLAGVATGLERRERVLRNDLHVDRLPLKVQAAKFLVRRAFDLRLIDRAKYLELRAIITLSDPASPDPTIAPARHRIRGGFFLGPNLESDIVAAGLLHGPKRRVDMLRAIVTAARIRASKARVPQAFADYQREHGPPIIKAARKQFAAAQRAAFESARARLGSEVSASRTAEETDPFSYSLFDEE